MDNAHRRVSLQVDNVFILIDSRLRLHCQISELLVVSTKSSLSHDAYSEKYTKFFDEFVSTLTPSTTPIHTNAYTTIGNTIGIVFGSSYFDEITFHIEH